MRRANKLAKTGAGNPLVDARPCQLYGNVALAARLNTKLLEDVWSANIYKYIGEYARVVGEIFRYAREQGMCMILILDNITNARF